MTELVRLFSTPPVHDGSQNVLGANIAMCGSNRKTVSRVNGFENCFLGLFRLYQEKTPCENARGRARFGFQKSLLLRLRFNLPECINPGPAQQPQIFFAVACLKRPSEKIGESDHKYSPHRRAKPF